MTERNLVKTPQAAKALDIAPSTLRAAAADGRLKPAAVTPGGHYLWDIPDTRRQLAEAAQRPRPGVVEKPEDDR